MYYGINIKWIINYSDDFSHLPSRIPIKIHAYPYYYFIGYFRISNIGYSEIYKSIGI